MFRHQDVKFVEAAGDRTAVEAGGELAFVGLDVCHKPNVAVESSLS
jgi:hypothetical protein